MSTDLTQQTVTVETLPSIVFNEVRVITTELLAQVYGTDPVRIRQNFSENKDRFEIGKHFFLLEGEALRQFKDLHRVSSDYSVEISPRVKALTLWTERGAARHAKLLETDQAWDVFERLEDCYFNNAKAVRAMSPAELIIAQGKAMLALEQEQARQSQKIKALEARVDMMDGDTGYMTVTAYARRIGQRLPLSKANELGKQATRLAKKLGVRIGTVPDERFSKVNSYPIALLDEIAAEFLKQPPESPR